MANQWLERELEDYVAADLYRFFDATRMGGNIENFELGIIGRQIKCQFGTLDLLVYSTHRETPIPIYTVTLIEFKAVQADKKTVEQVTRYMAALEEVGIYDAVPNESFSDYAHVVDDYIFFESMIVAPSFSEAIKWYPNRIVATKADSGFTFSFDKGNKRTQQGNADLQAAMMPLIIRATESARQWHVSQRLQGGLDGTGSHTENN